MCHSVLSLLVHKGIFVLPIAKEICVVSSLISPVPVAARSKAYVCGRSPVEIVGSVPTGGAWMFVCCECCVLSGRGLYDELITRLEESYRLWCVVVCDLEQLIIGYINEIIKWMKYLGG